MAENSTLFTEEEAMLKIMIWTVVVYGDNIDGRTLSFE